jgi:hypothetical protein
MHQQQQLAYKEDRQLPCLLLPFGIAHLQLPQHLSSSSSSHLALTVYSPQAELLALDQSQAIREAGSGEAGKEGNLR